MQGYGLALVLAATGMLALGGCGDSEYPISDNNSSIDDPRLFGGWAIDPSADEDSPGEVGGILFIGRADTHDNVLELLHMEWDGRGHLEVHRQPLFTVQLAGKWYASVQGNPAKGSGFMLFRYSIEGTDTLRLYAMNDERVRQAISKGELRGKIQQASGASATEESPPGSTSRGLVETLHSALEQYLKDHPGIPHVQASPEELATFLRVHGPSCFDGDPCQTLQRVQTGSRFHDTK
jgi:hypothetical protein